MLYYIIYCIVLYCIILYSDYILNCIVLYCIVLHCIALHFISLYRIFLKQNQHMIINRKGVICVTEKGRLISTVSSDHKTPQNLRHTNLLWVF